MRLERQGLSFPEGPRPWLGAGWSGRCSEGQGGKWNLLLLPKTDSLAGHFPASGLYRVMLKLCCAGPLKR